MLINKFLLLKLFGATFGAILGYLYWHFVGCENGCTIQSVWWKMSAWGSVMGFLLLSIVGDAFEKKL